MTGFAREHTKLSSPSRNQSERLAVFRDTQSFDLVYALSVYSVDGHSHGDNRFAIFCRPCWGLARKISAHFFNIARPLCRPRPVTRIEPTDTIFLSKTNSRRRLDHPASSAGLTRVSCTPILFVVHSALFIQRIFMKKNIQCLAIISDNEFLIGSPIDGSTEIVQVRIVKRYKEAMQSSAGKSSAPTTASDKKK